jgi:hypothetical protein
MLPPFIIEQIRRREEAQRRKSDAKQPRLELPVDVHRPGAPRPGSIPGSGYEPAGEPDGSDEDHNRGVVIVDL